MSLARTSTLKLKAGTLLEPDESDDSQKLPSRRQVMRLESNIDKLPTSEVLRRLYKRHAVNCWQAIAILTWVIVIYNAVR